VLEDPPTPPVADPVLGATAHTAVAAK